MSASERQKQSTRRTALAGLIGNVMEWFDFAVYGYFASVIGAQFFPQSSPHAQLLLTFAVFLPIMLVIYRVPPSATMLLFPVFLALQVLFITGLALGLSAATALFRDVRHLIDVCVAVLFWSTPIVYEISRVPEQVQFLALLSPSAPFMSKNTWPGPSVPSSSTG